MWKLSGPMSYASHDEPVAAESFGDATQVELTNLEPSSWLLELGAAARTVELRAELQQGLGHPIRAWSSRRAGARARRELLQQAFAATVVDPGPRQAAGRAVSPLPEPFDPADWQDTMELPEIAEPDRDEDSDRPAEESPAASLLARIGAYTVSYDRSTFSAR